MPKLYSTSFACFFTIFILMVSADPVANNGQYQTHFGVPVTGSFTFTDNGAQGTIKILVNQLPVLQGRVDVTGTSFTYTPYHKDAPADVDKVQSFTFRVQIGDQISNSATITITMKAYLCLSSCPVASRWETRSYNPRLWGPAITEDDFTATWENSALTFRVIGQVGNGGQRVNGFKEAKYHPQARPLLNSAALSNGMYTIDTSCLDSTTWPNQFAGPSASVCTTGLNRAAMCSSAPLFSRNNRWQLSFGDAGSCTYTWTGRFGFGAIVPGTADTYKNTEGTPIFDVHGNQDGTLLIMKTTFYSSVIQPNNPNDVTRGWEDLNMKYDVTLTVATDIDISIEQDIISCDPHCERRADGSLFCQDYCNRRPDQCRDNNAVTTSVMSSTFDSGSSSVTTVTQTFVADGSYILETTIAKEGADAAGTFDGTVVLQVCVCTACTTYTRVVQDRMSSISIKGGFVGQVKTCRANPTSPNPLTTANTICAEVDAKTYGPPDRATLFFDIVDVETQYVEPVKVSASFTSWGVSKAPIFRNAGYGDGTSGFGLTGQEDYLGYYEALAAVRTAVYNEKQIQSDFAFTIMPGVTNDNFKMTISVTLQVHAQPHNREPNSQPVPVNPYNPSKKRFHSLQDASGPQPLKLQANLQVDSKFNSVQMAAAKSQVGFNGGSKTVPSVSSTGNKTPSTSSSSSSSSDNSVLIASVVGGICMIGLVVAAVVVVRMKNAKAANLRRGSTSDIKITVASQSTSA